MLWIDGVKMPTPKQPGGIVIMKEKIWSKNAGRAANGVMVGDIVAIKNKLQITWPPLSPDQVIAIDAVISKAFFAVKYLDPSSNTLVTRIFYAGTPTYSVYSYATGFKQYDGVGVDLVEK